MNNKEVYLKSVDELNKFIQNMSKYVDKLLVAKSLWLKLKNILINLDIFKCYILKTQILKTKFKIWKKFFSASGT